MAPVPSEAVQVTERPLAAGFALLTIFSVGVSFRTVMSFVTLAAVKFVVAAYEAAIERVPPTTIRFVVKVHAPPAVRSQVPRTVAGLVIGSLKVTVPVESSDTTIPPDTKRCATCREVHPLVEYYADARRSDGRRVTCKHCHNVYRRRKRALVAAQRQRIRDQRAVS